MTRLQAMRPGPVARGILLAAPFILAASLSGCGSANSGMPPDTSRQLQELVLGVSQSAAANDHPAALRTLDNLEADLTTAASSGQVSEERRRSILTSITAIRTDLTAAADAAAAAKAAEESTAAAAAAAAKAKADAEAEAEGAAAAVPEYAAPVVAAPAPAPRQAPAQNNGKEGKGKNKKNG